MTTAVVITSPDPNHENLKVTSEYIDAEGNVSSYASTQILSDGETCQLYVHGAMRVTITEVQKGPPVVVPDPEPQEAAIAEPVPADPDAVPLETAA